MENHEHIALLKQGVEAWNQWRQENPHIRPELCRDGLTGADLAGVDLTGADLTGADLRGAELRGAYLNNANLTGADLKAADLTGAHLFGANLTEADLMFADISSAIFISANFKNACVIGVEWNSRTMRGNYHGARGLDSCYGDGVFKRAALDQVYLDSLEYHWAGTWRTYLFRMWGLIDYGRSLSRVAGIACVFIMLYGFIYSQWPELLGLDCKPDGMACEQGQKIPHSWFTPFYFSIVTYSTLGYGDIAPQTLIGEIIVSSEVLMGYMTFGLLLSVLAEKVARRS